MPAGLATKQLYVVSAYICVCVVCVVCVFVCVCVCVCERWHVRSYKQSRYRPEVAQGFPGS